MSSSTTVSSHTRSKSLRVPPLNSLRPVQSSQPTAGPSNIALFLTNLRLLNLDLREDWPGITVLTFSTKDNQQNQKKRVQCVEWALYQLFALWDPDEARNKLQPFFPPLEPLQSLNLRTALFRCLDQAKKNGVLGRDTVLRKTMLDECKGEKLEEVLSVFSNAVLKKVIQETQATKHDALAQKLALENLSYTGERTALSALIVAHKASLSKYSRQKEESRARYQDFSDLLNLNERRIARRQEQLKETVQQHGDYEKISGREARALQDQVQRNWSGSPEWLESVLYGDSRASAEGLLATRYDKVWKHVENGSIGDVESKHQVGLLEQLDARVKDQEERLARWQDFGRTLAKVEASSPAKKASLDIKQPKKIDLGFNRHQALQIGQGSPKNTSQANGPSLEEYTRLIENMKSELADVEKAQTPSKRLPRQSLLSEKRRSSTMPSPASPVEAQEDSVDEENEEWSSASDTDGPSPNPTRTSPKSSSPNTALKDSGVDVQSKDVTPEPPSPEPLLTMSPISRSALRSPEKILSPRRRRTIAKTEQPPSPEPIIRTPSPIEQYLTRTPSPMKSPMRKPASPTKSSAPKLETESDLADQILNSLSTASPSPKKLRHTLSLAERTRLSMSRTTLSKYSDLHDKFELDELPTPRLSINRPSMTIKIPTAESDNGMHADLIERTRKSMAGFEAAQKRAQIERRRSVKDAAKKQRQSSYFPKVQEETGVADTSAIELLEAVGEAGYEDVFKSRPKIATSPAASISPTKIWEEQEDEE